MRRLLSTAFPLAAALFWLSTSASPAIAQVLDQVRQEVREGDSNGAPPASQRDQHRYESQDVGPNGSGGNTDYEDELPVDVWIAALAAPIFVPMSMLDDNWCRPGYFPDAPYADGLPGSMVIRSQTTCPPRNWSLQASVEAGDVNGRLDRIGGDFLLSTTSRLDLGGEWNYFTERTAIGTDQLALGDVNVLVRFAQNELMQARTGIGINWLGDEERGDVGVNFTYGAQLYPRRPWTFGWDLDWGTLAHATQFHLRATAGVTYHGCELFAGYDFRKIDDVELEGPLAGARLYF